MSISKESVDDAVKTPWYRNIFDGSEEKMLENKPEPAKRKSRSPMWNDETLGTYRVEAIQAAKELGYDQQCLDEVKNADSMNAISIAMTHGRHRLVKREEEAITNRNKQMENNVLYALSKLSNELKEATNAMKKFTYAQTNSEEKEFVPASFGVDEGHIDRYYEQCLNNDTEGRQLDILQEECAELIKAVAKVKRMQELSRKDDKYINSKEIVEQWYEACANLAEEMAHVAISSAVVSRVLGVSQEEIDAVVKRKDELPPKPEIGVDLANGSDMTIGGK